MAPRRAGPTARNFQGRRGSGLTRTMLSGTLLGGSPPPPSNLTQFGMDSGRGGLPAAERATTGNGRRRAKSWVQNADPSQEIPSQEIRVRKSKSPNNLSRSLHMRKWLYEPLSSIHCSRSLSLALTLSPSLLPSSAPLFLSSSMLSLVTRSLPLPSPSD